MQGLIADAKEAAVAAERMYHEQYMVNRRKFARIEQVGRFRLLFLNVFFVIVCDLCVICV